LQIIINFLIFALTFFEKPYIVKNLQQYSIPFKGLNDGLHELTFKVDVDFFRHFEESYLDDGNLDIKVDLDKRPNMMVLDVVFSGTVKTLCDLCGDEGDLPIEGTEQLLVKFTEHPGEEEQVIYLMPDANELNLAFHFYEFIALSVPIRKVPCADDEGEPTCNSEALNLLDGNEEHQDDNVTNPIWAELEKLKNK